MTKPQNIVAGFGALLLLPLVLQFITWYVEDQPYSLTRAVGILAVVFTIIVGTLALAYARRRSLELLLVALLLDGLATMAVGLYIILERTPPGTNPLFGDVTGITALCSGLFVVLAVVYLVKTTRGDIKLGRGTVPSAEGLQRWSATTNGPVIHRAQNQIRPDRDLEPVLSRPLHLDGLHYVSLYTRGRFQFSTDILEKSGLNMFFSSDKTRDDRRYSYRAKSLSLGEMVRQLNPHLEDIESGKLIRLVLDVRFGALYYYWVDDENYLVGVTLKQLFVNEADRDMEQLVDEIRRIDLGERPVAEMEQG